MSQVKPLVSSRTTTTKTTPKTRTKIKPGVVVDTPVILLLWEAEAEKS